MKMHASLGISFFLYNEEESLTSASVEIFIQKKKYFALGKIIEIVLKKLFKNETWCRSPSKSP